MLSKRCGMLAAFDVRRAAVGRANLPHDSSLIPTALDNMVRKSFDPRQPAIMLTRGEERVLDIGVPAWSTESQKAKAIRRVRGSAKIGFTAILTEVEEKIWGHADPRSIQVRRKTGTFTAPRKLGKGGIDVRNITETFRWNPAGSTPAW
jgi:hypothetical protein